MQLDTSANTSPLETATTGIWKRINGSQRTTQIGIEVLVLRRNGGDEAEDNNVIARLPLHFNAFPDGARGCHKLIDEFRQNPALFIGMPAEN